jgi:hypothetical protein
LGRQREASPAVKRKKIGGERSKKFHPLVTDFGRFVKQPFSPARRMGYFMAMHPAQDAPAFDFGDPRC